MFAVGHMALAYLLGKASAKPLEVKPNVPLLLVLSIIPDMDILVGSEFHRGPTHSIIAAILVFIPIFYFYRKRAIPYLLALASHMLIGDLIIGGRLMLFWPLLTTKIFLSAPFPQLSIYSSVNLALEFTLFIAATLVMLKTKDLLAFFQKHTSNLLLAIPVFTVLLPTFLGYPLVVPLLLVLPHLFYLIIFSIAVLRGLFPAHRLPVQLPKTAQTHKV